MQDKVEQATVLLKHLAGFLDAEGLDNYYFTVKCSGDIEIHFEDKEVESVFRLKYSTDEIIEYIVKQATK